MQIKKNKLSDDPLQVSRSTSFCILSAANIPYNTLYRPAYIASTGFAGKICKEKSVFPHILSPRLRPQADKGSRNTRW